MGGRARRVSPRVKKPKVRSLKSLKKEADRVFSIWIRKRGMTPNGLNVCVSCGVVKHWTELQCGHYFSRVHLGTRFDERNCHPQCPACNVFKGGNYPNFARFMYRKFGEGVIDELSALTRKVKKFTVADYEELIRRYS